MRRNWFKRKPKVEVEPPKCPNCKHEADKHLQGATQCSVYWDEETFFPQDGLWRNVYRQCSCQLSRKDVYLNIRKAKELKECI